METGPVRGRSFARFMGNFGVNRHHCAPMPPGQSSPGIAIPAILPKGWMAGGEQSPISAWVIEFEFLVGFA